ncbi:inositol-3-phosphate synthase, partial [Candidatus Bathyarchaeota archaeon]|nr:inositol-3-phosphate synthase [Candidatus Bathyarchaeota archaeon]
MSIRVAIVGIGNCASALVQGVEYYKNAKDDDEIPGLMHVNFGGYHIRDIEFVAAFDVNKNKIGKDLSEAIFAEPNCCARFTDVPKLGVRVLPAPLLDGVAPHMKNEFHIYEEADTDPVDVASVLKETQADMLINFMPVGSYKATRHYAQVCLDTGVAFVNCIPEFIASDSEWSQKFEAKKIPIAGDDIKSQIGATILHRAIVDLLVSRGVKI